MSELKKKKKEIESLVVEVQKGDQQAFSDLYDLFIDPIYRYVYYKVRKTECEDIVETVFLKVWENAKKYSAEKGNFSSWVFRIAHNAVVDHYRKLKDLDFDELSDYLPTMEREHNAISRTKNYLDKKILRVALDKLKDNYQQILILKFINDLSNSEIAEILGKSEGSLRILQMRALAALRKEMDDLGVEVML